MSVQTHPWISDAIPFWFAMTSPVIGVVVGLLLVWLLGGLLSGY